MEKINELVLAKVPGALVEEKQYTTITVQPAELRALAQLLHAEGFDFMVQLTGVDYGDALGVVYLLCKSSDMSCALVMQTATSDRENPVLPSVSDIWSYALLNEREVFGFLGIKFIDPTASPIPDKRWKGFPSQGLRCKPYGQPDRREELRYA